MVDRLQSLLSRFAVSAEVFHAGPLCGINDLAADGERGQLHLIRDGHVRVEHADGSVLQIDRPSVLLYPRPLAHRFVTDARRGADFACAHLQFEGGGNNPVAAALPSSLTTSTRSHWPERPAGRSTNGRPVPSSVCSTSPRRW